MRVLEKMGVESNNAGSCIVSQNNSLHSSPHQRRFSHLMIDEDEESFKDTCCESGVAGGGLRVTGGNGFNHHKPPLSAKGQTSTLS